MRRISKIISYICLAGLMLGAVRIGAQLPADTGEYIEKKYAGWTGVLRGWVCSEWSCAGSFVSWLNSCAAEFEKAHEGVYLEFETVSASAMRAGDIHPPHMLIFSDGILPADTQTVAMGGYVFVENPDAAGTVISQAHCAPLIAMYADAQLELPESGLDLGLPAMARGECIEIAEDAFARFMNGEVGRTIVDQAQLAKLIALRDSGRGPDWRCTVQGGYSWADQRLMLGIAEEEDAPRQLCEAFLSFLLEEEQQAMLSSIGAFPATGISAYDSFSAYRPMEQQILATQPLFSKSEHSASVAADLVRKLSAGDISAVGAAELLRQTCA